MEKKYFVGYDFEFSKRTGRLHNIGLEPQLAKSGWKVIKPKLNESKAVYWMRALCSMGREGASILFFMPSYKAVVLLGCFAFFFKKRLILGLRDLWFGNPQPISSVRGRIFRSSGYYIFWFLSKVLTTKYVVISPEMKEELLRLHPFICANDVILSSTGTEILEKESNRDIMKNDIGYFGTFDLQMDFEIYNSLKGNFDFVHYGNNDFGGWTNGYLSTKEDLNNQMAICRSLVVFGVDDKARLNRKIFHYLLFEVPIFYFGPNDNVTFRILSQYDGVFINPTFKIIEQEIALGNSYVRDITEYTYDVIGKKLVNELLHYTK